MDANGRKHYLTRWEGLKTERSSWDGHWKELAQYVLPRSSRFLTTDRNRGDKKHNRIYDNTATRALRTLSAGLMAGMTSPARPWFRIATVDRDRMQSQAVKEWCYDVTTLMLRIFAVSNTYRALHTIYDELGLFGTGCDIVMPNFNNVIHHHPNTAGEYAIFTDDFGIPCGMYREFDYTVAQLVKKFGKENCSRAVQNLFDRGGKGLDAWVTVLHAIEPRDQRDYSRIDNKNMPFASCYIEIGADSDRILSESGFRYFNALCPRWTTTGTDIYGTSAAMDALGDIKQLQQQQLSKSEAIAYKVKPPLQAPVAFKELAHNLFPGGMSFVDSATAQQGIRTAFEVNLDLSHLLEDIHDVRGRIDRAFYADLFLMLANDPVGQKTATEIAERHEEKMLMIGPVLERLHNELLDPLIDITFAECAEAGILPQIPPELEGQDLKVEFVSVLAQAQRAIGANGLDRYIGTVSAVASVKPDILDKLNVDELADYYADILGVEPRLIIPTDQAAIVRQQRAQQAAMANAAEMAPKVSSAAVDMSQIQQQNPGATGNMLRALTGYT